MDDFSACVRKNPPPSSQPIIFITGSAAEDSAVTIEVHYPFGVQRILLITEEHTKNPYYLENVYTISDLIQKAGYQVRLAFPKDLPEVLTLESSTGHQLQFGSGFENSAWVKDFNPDLIISNNDFSLSMQDWGQQMTKPMNPPRGLGWYQRKKSRYFKNYNQLVTEFSFLAKIDPFLMQVQTEEFSTFDINDESSRKKCTEKQEHFNC